MKIWRKSVGTNILLLLSFVMFSGSVLAQSGTEASDGWAFIMAIGAFALFMAAGVLIVAQHIFFDKGQPSQKWALFAAFILIVLGLFSAIGATIETTTVTIDDDAGVPIVYTASMADNATFIEWSDLYNARWGIDFNSTGDGAFTNVTNTAMFTLQVGRLDNSATDQVENAVVSNIGTTTGTDDVERSIVAKGTDTLPQADWTDESGVTWNLIVGMATTEVDRSVTANLTIDLSPSAFDKLLAQQGSTITITYDEFTWVISVYVRNIAAL